MIVHLTKSPGARAGASRADKHCRCAENCNGSEALGKRGSTFAQSHNSLDLPHVTTAIVRRALPKWSGLSDADDRIYGAIIKKASRLAAYGFILFGTIVDRDMFHNGYDASHLDTLSRYVLRANDTLAEVEGRSDG